MAYQFYRGEPQYVQDWYRDTGGNWGAWFAGAPDLGVPMYDASRVARTEMTPWGENKQYDAAGNEISLVNPEWMTRFNAWKGGQQQPSQQQAGLTGDALPEQPNLPPLTYTDPLSLYNAAGTALAQSFAAPGQSLFKRSTIPEDEFRRLGIY